MKTDDVCVSGLRSPFMESLTTGTNSSKVPVWCMRQAGRYQLSYQALRKTYSFEELCYTPELSCQVALLPIEEMELDAAILFSDILFPLRALGLGVRFNENSVPSIYAKEGANSHSARIYTALHCPPSIEEVLVDCCGPIYEAMRLLCLSCPKPVLGFSGAPWTLMTYVLEGQSSPGNILSRALLLQDPNTASSLLHRLEELVVSHLNNQIDAGCDAVQIFDSWASELSPQDFALFAQKPLQRIIRSLHLKKDGTPCPVLYFSKGISARLPMLSGTGIHGISCDTQTDLPKLIDWAEKESIALQGNLDPALLCLEKGNPELERRLVQLLREMSPYRKYIFNFGHGIPKDAKYETVRYVVETVHSWMRGE